MEHLGFWSILPVLLAIACAVVTRNVILALFLGVYALVLAAELAVTCVVWLGRRK